MCKAIYYVGASRGKAMVVVELLVRHNSPVQGSVHPGCGDPKCGFALEKCPRCGGNWTIPHTLRDRVTFLLPEEALRSSFVKARNNVFHSRHPTPIVPYTLHFPVTGHPLFLLGIHGRR